MVAVVKDRPKLAPMMPDLAGISALATSCIKQLQAWSASIEHGPIQGKRRLTKAQAADRKAADAVRSFRQQFLASIKPEHPLYHSDEARAARGEAADERP
jgi:hypothetical protein